MKTHLAISVQLQVWLYLNSTLMLRQALQRVLHEAVPLPVLVRE